MEGMQVSGLTVTVPSFYFFLLIFVLNLKQRIMTKLKDFKDLKDSSRKSRAYKISLFSLDSDYGFVPKKEVRTNSLMLELM